MSSEQRLTIPHIHNFKQILALASKAASRGPCPRAALVVPSGITMLTAFARAAREGLIEPHILGDEKLLLKNLAEHKLEIPGMRVLDINQPDVAVKTAARMTAAGEIDLLVKGRLPAMAFLQLLWDEDAAFITKGQPVSHLAVLKPERYAKLLIVTDGAVTAEPDLKQKIAIIQNAISFAGAIGVEMPRIAVLAAVEVVYPQMPVTTEAAVLSKMGERGQIKGGYIDGPLSFDVAMDLFAAHSKGIKKSRVAGQADVMVAPNMETAYGIYTAMSMYGHSDVGGVIYGGRVPVALATSVDSAEACFNSIALAVLARGPGA